MRIFKIRSFNRWSVDQGLDNDALKAVVDEMENGLKGNSLGGGIFKKRVATKGQGKSGSARTIIAFKSEFRSFFIYGFAKNEKDNISDKETKALKTFAKGLQKMTDKEIEEGVQS